MGYQPRTKLVKIQKCYLCADSYNVSNTWKDFFSQLLNLHGVSDVRQREMHTAEPLAPELGPFHIETATEKLKGYKSPGID
jgi:hypothetical protein